MVYVDGNGIPLSLMTESAQVSEFHLALPTIDAVEVPDRPLHPKKRAEVLIADKGYDAKWLRDAIRERNIRPKIPKKRRRGQSDEPVYNQAITEFYRTRWIVERTIAWLGAYRRLLIRWERQDDIYEAFVTIACSMFCLRRVLI